MSNPFESPEALEYQAETKSLRIKSVGVLSTGMISGAVGVIFGLVIGIMFSLFGAFGVLMSNGPNNGAQVGVVLGTAVMMPILYGISMLLFGLMTAVVYNLVAGLTGGIEIELGQR